MRRSSVDQAWMVRVSGSGSRENRLLGICLMVSGIVIFRVKIDFSECNRHSAPRIDCYHWHPLASILPIIVLDAMFSIKLPDGIQKSNQCVENQIPNHSSITLDIRCLFVVHRRSQHYRSRFTSTGRQDRLVGVS